MKDKSANLKIPPELKNIYCRLGKHTNFPWTPLPWKGIFNKVLFTDPITGAIMELAKVEKGSKFPEHYHTSVQTLFLVSGLLRSDSTVIEPGTFNIIPAGQLHGPFYAEEESIQFKYFSSIPVYILKDGTTYIYKKDGKTISAGKLSFTQKIKTKNFISE